MSRVPRNYGHIMGCYYYERDCFPSAMHWRILIHYPQHFSNKKKNQKFKAYNRALTVEIHIYVSAHCFDFLLCGSQAIFNASTVKQNKTILIFILKSTASVIIVNQYSPQLTKIIAIKIDDKRVKQGTNVSL